MRPFGDPAKVALAAEKLKEWSQGRLEADHLQDAKFDRLKVLKKLSALSPADFPDYDSARQIVAAIQVIYREWAPKLARQQKIDNVLAALVQEFNLQPYTGRTARIELFRQAFSKLSGEQYLKAKGAVEAFERISNHGLLESFPEKDPKTKDVARSLRDFLSAINRDGGGKLTDALLNDPKTRDEFLAALHKINEGELRRIDDPAESLRSLDVQEASASAGDSVPGRQGRRLTSLPPLVGSLPDSSFRARSLPREAAWRNDESGSNAFSPSHRPPPRKEPSRAWSGPS